MDRKSLLVLLIILLCSLAIGIPPPVHAAVTLYKFEANWISTTQVQVEWATWSEVDNAGFVLYRARPQDRYWGSPIKVFQQSNPNGASYSYVDTPPQYDTYYYRLQSVDKAGKFEELRVVPAIPSPSSTPNTTLTSTSTPTPSGTPTQTATRTATPAGSVTATPTATATTPVAAAFTATPWRTSTPFGNGSGVSSPTPLYATQSRPSGPVSPVQLLPTPTEWFVDVTPMPELAYPPVTTSTLEPTSTVQDNSTATATLDISENSKGKSVTGSQGTTSAGSLTPMMWLTVGVIMGGAVVVLLVFGLGGVLISFLAREP